MKHRVLLRVAGYDDNDQFLTRMQFFAQNALYHRLPHPPWLRDMPVIAPTDSITTQVAFAAADSRRAT